MNKLFWGICAVTLGTIVTFVIHSRCSTYIGDKGKRSMTLDGILFLIIGVLLVSIDIVNVLFGNNVCPMIVRVVVAFFAILCMAAGVATLIRTKQETNSEIVITRLVACSIYDESRTIRGLPRISLKGNSLENRKNYFTFTGKDIHIMKNALKNGITNVEIRYYKASGRICQIKLLK